MKASTRIVVSALAVIALAPAVADAKPTWRIYGVGNYSQFKAEVDGTASRFSTNRKLGFGGGIGVEAMLGKMVSLEAGGAFIQRKSEIAGTTTTFNFIEVPVLFRLWFGNIVNVGLGGYVGMGIGDISQSAGGVSGTTTYALAGLKTLDYGALGSVGFDIPMGSSAGIFVEGRYAYGLANASDVAGVTGKFNDMRAVAGFRFGGSKK